MSQSNKNPDYWPDCRRSVYVTSVIDQASTERFTREVIPFVSGSNEPITLFIDSPGGSIHYSERIYRTIKLPRQENGQSSRLITVGLNVVASAACDLLIAGDYSIVYPQTLLLCHGVRQSGNGLDVTRETALSLAQSLARSNEQFALQLAENAISRFIFRFVSLRHTFESIREAKKNPNLSDASAFLMSIDPHVSRELMSLLRQAMINYLDNDLIDFAIRQKVLELGDATPEEQVEFEALILECIIEHQKSDTAAKSPEWSFRTHGLPELESKFSILVSGHSEAHRTQIEKLVLRWGEFLLSESEGTIFKTVPEEDREDWLTKTVTQTVRSLWFLFVGICRLLQ
jgi:ATP-dependent protease ClpP protease subunit